VGGVGGTRHHATTRTTRGEDAHDTPDSSLSPVTNKNTELVEAWRLSTSAKVSAKVAGDGITIRVTREACAPSKCPALLLRDASPAPALHLGGVGGVAPLPHRHFSLHAASSYSFSVCASFCLPASHGESTRHRFRFHSPLLRNHHDGCLPCLHLQSSAPDSAAAASTTAGSAAPAAPPAAPAPSATAPAAPVAAAAASSAGGASSGGAGAGTSGAGRARSAAAAAADDPHARATAMLRLKSDLRSLQNDPPSVGDGREGFGTFGCGCMGVVTAGLGAGDGVCVRRVRVGCSGGRRLCPYGCAPSLAR
jgi:hypothetical protein